jgi:branched-chain amino acid transport system permease protein
LVAGLSFAFVPQIFTAYLSPWWGQIPPALFGLGAILVARNPEGTLAMHARQIEGLFKKDRQDPLAVAAAADRAEHRAAQAALASAQSPEEVPNR